MGKFLQSEYPPRLGRLWAVTLLAAIFLFSSIPVVCASVTADYQVNTDGEGSPRLSFSVKNASLEEVLLTLKKKTNYYFLYNSKAVRAISGITLKVQNASVESILSSCLKSTPFEYTIKDNTIVIKAKPGQEQLVAQEDPRRLLLGTVTSQHTKQPLAGVTVYVKGGRHGTVTDSRGEYILEFEPQPAPKETNIVFSFVGMETQTIPFTGQTRINVVMKESADEMENVVVTGYANIRRESLRVIPSRSRRISCRRSPRPM